MSHLKVTIAVLAGLLLGCTGGSPVEPVPTMAIADLQAAPLGATLAGTSFTVTVAALTRDFMPPSPADGKPLLAVLRVRTADGSPFPAGVRVDAAWVVFGDVVWGVAPAEE